LVCMRDVVIVGAGIIGCAIARELAARRTPCTVIDDRPVGGGATRASAGMLAPYVEAHDRGPLLDLAIRSLDLYDDWIAALRRDADVDVEYRRIGTLEVALDAEHAAALGRNVGAHAGVAMTWMAPADARRAHPALGPIAGALFIPTHGYVAAPQLATALARAAERRGTRFHRAAVRVITRTGSSFRVTTTDGDVDASIVILAAGAWTNGIDGVRTPPLRPVRGQLLQLGWRGEPLASIIWGPSCYIVPRSDGSVLVGATVEDVGFDERTTAAGIRDLLDAACALLPEAGDATFLDARAGLRPATPDELPVIGPDVDAPGIVHASGHYRNGVLLAPITARVIAAFIVEGKTDPCFEAFRAHRFW
jgi:glycine oxidase